LVDKLYGKIYEDLVFEYNSSDSRKLSDIINIMKVTQSKLSRENIQLNKLLILEEADGLPIETQTLLIKYLINKNNKTNYILTCNDINKITEILILNYDEIKFRKLDSKELVANFIKILQKEKITYEFESLNKIANHCNGDMRMGINYLQSTSNLYNEINEDFFLKIIDLRNPLIEKKLFEFCLEKNLNKVFEIIDEILVEGYSFQQIRLFFDEGIRILNCFSINFPDVLKQRLIELIQLEKENNSDNICQIYGFFAIIINLFKQFNV